MVLYGITLVPLAEDLRAAAPGLLSPFYVDGRAFGGFSRQSAQLLKILMERGPDQIVWNIIEFDKTYVTHTHTTL